MARFVCGFGTIESPICRHLTAHLTLSSPMDVSLVSPDPFSSLDAHDRSWLITHTQRLLWSFHHWTGRSLLDVYGSPWEQVQQLWDAPFGLLSHNTDVDPIFTYGNRQALQTFGYSWVELTQLPSRLSAEPQAQSDRDRLLAASRAQGVVEGYSGIRIRKTGDRFWIQDGTLWNLVDDRGEYHGQAATIDRLGNPD